MKLHHRIPQLASLGQDRPWEAWSRMLYPLLPRLTSTGKVRPWGTRLGMLHPSISYKASPGLAMHWGDRPGSCAPLFLGWHSKCWPCTGQPDYGICAPLI